jgi:uncharacterized membrane protein YdbT with pleckstrin-like domain
MAVMVWATLVSYTASFGDSNDGSLKYIVAGLVSVASIFVVPTLLVFWPIVIVLGVMALYHATLLLKRTLNG